VCVCEIEVIEGHFNYTNTHTHFNYTGSNLWCAVSLVCIFVCLCECICVIQSTAGAAQGSSFGACCVSCACGFVCNCVYVFESTKVLPMPHRASEKVRAVHILRVPRVNVYVYR